METPCATKLDTVTSKKKIQESISNLLVKVKEDFTPVPEDSLTMKLRLISILSQNSKPSSEMEPVLSSKQETTTELLDLDKSTSMRQ